MILILGGTTEGREIATELAERGYPVMVTVASAYGAEMFSDSQPVEIMVGRLDKESFKRLMTQKKVKLVLDATHPYATLVTETAWQASVEKGIPFIRYERSGQDYQAETPSGDLVIRVEDYQEGAEAAINIASEQAGTVFLTIGSKNLRTFSEAAVQGNVRLVARVLPDPEVIRQCLSLNIKPGNIIAMQGPFSLELNVAMLKAYRAAVLVTKDSGKVGGADEKIQAAFQLGIPVVLVQRPRYTGIPVVYDIKEIFTETEKLINNQ